MKTSPDGVDSVKGWEQFRSTAYRDQGGKWTIGYGHLIQPGEEYYQTAIITEEQALLLLQSDLAIAEAAVNDSIIVQLKQLQFDSLVSLAYNIGADAFRHSTLVKKINLQDTQEVITTWWKAWRKVNGHDSPGLINRRAAEIEVYFSGYEPAKTRRIVAFFLQV
jgi:lysozyme